MGRFLTPDSAASAKPTEPSSSNKYAYVGGDPVNRTDPTGQDGEDSWGWDGGWGGFDPFGFLGREAQDDEWSVWYGIAIYDQSIGNCSLGKAFFENILGGGTGDFCDQAADQGPPPDPTLECNFQGAIIFDLSKRQAGGPGGPFALSYVVPIDLHFAATGGNGTYAWNIDQVYSLTTTDSKGGTTTTTHESGTEKLPYTLNPNGALANFQDAPGLQIGRGRFTVTGTWNFTDHVTVSSGGQTVDCPTVVWTASITIKSSRKNVKPKGTASVISP